nr:hypothetical protein [uncultured Oscillibacter sp.]
MRAILYEDYIFHTDAAANRQDYARRPAAPVALSGYLPELTAFLDTLGIDINKPRPPFGDFSDLCYDIQGTFSTASGCELDFSAPGKYVSCVLFGKNGRITVEVFGIRL